MTVNVYVASKAKYGPVWQAYRLGWGLIGINVVSTWIDESGEGETADFSDLWQRCVREVQQADYLIAMHYGDEIWKGAFIEIGGALATNTPVLLVGDPPGTWMHHPLVSRFGTVDACADHILSSERDRAALLTGGG